MSSATFLLSPLKVNELLWDIQECWPNTVYLCNTIINLLLIQCFFLNQSQGGEHTSQKRMTKTISYSAKHPFKSVSCCQFPFRYSDINQDRLTQRMYQETKHLYGKTWCITALSLLRALVYNFVMSLSKYCAWVFSTMTIH